MGGSYVPDVDAMLQKVIREWRRLAIVSALVIVGLGLASGYSTSASAGITVAIATASLLANALMAIGALAAVSMWRKQIEGTSQHEVAKRVAKQLQLVLSAGTNLLISWSNWRGLSEPNVLVASRLFDALERYHEALAPLQELTIDVRALWDESTAAPFESFANGECMGFAIDVQLEINGNDPPELLEDRNVRYDSARPDGYWHKWFKAWIRLLADWARPHVGARGAIAMTPEAFKARYEALLRPPDLDHIPPSMAAKLLLPRHRADAGGNGAAPGGTPASVENT